MKISITILFVAVLCACAGKMKSEVDLASLEANPVANADAKTAVMNDIMQPIGDEKLIKTADYKFKVNNVKKATEAIENAVKKFPAHISNSNLAYEGSRFENTLVIRVQNEFFTELLNEIDKHAIYVHYRNVRTQDVSKEFVDLESRLKTKREVEERYKEILRKKAGTIEELLAAERQIGELQEEIEATISRINYLKDQVSYSTINLTYYETVSDQLVAEEEDSIWKKFGEAFSSGGRGAEQFLIAITNVWPVIILGLIAFLVIKLRKKPTPVIEP
jgi:hypothetical protein